MNSLSRKDALLLIALTIAWGINWPIMKIGVQNFPPLSFRTLCMLIGLPVIWLAARWQGASLKVRADQVGPVLRLAVSNMLLWHMLIILGVKLLSSGRAAILGYTMPAWAVLFGLLFFGERILPVAWLGVSCALGGALLLLSGELTALSGQPLGSLLAIAAAACWGYGTVALKRSELRIPTISLTFWMLLPTTLIMVVAAAVFEQSAWRMPNAIEWAAIVYNGLIVFGFAHVVWFQLARTLPPIASSLSIMMIPVVGIFSGASLLGETLHWQDYAAMLLILAGMSTVLLRPAAKPEQT
jgi:drug/metabolite transporter (DMT)-like permease